MSFLGLKGKNRAPALIEYTAPTPPPPLLDGIHSDEPYVSFNSIHTAFPDINESDVDAQQLDFPITFENDADFIADASSEASQDPELASFVSYLPEAQILARILGEGKTLELRWLGNGTDTKRRIRSDNETLIRITFPRALRDISTSKCMHLNPTTGELVVVLLDQWSDIYRLSFKHLKRNRETGYMFQIDRQEMHRNTISIAHALHRHTDIPTSANSLIWSVYSEDNVVITFESLVIRCSWDGSGRLLVTASVERGPDSSLFYRVEFCEHTDYHKSEIWTGMAIHLQYQSTSCIRNNLSYNICSPKHRRQLRIRIRAV